MAHNEKSKVNWNKDIVYKDENHFLESQLAAGTELPLEDLKEAYKSNYAKSEEKTKK